MIVYNSLARPYTGMVRVPVIKEGISVTDPDGNTVPVQVMMMCYCGNASLLFSFRLFLIFPSIMTRFQCLLAQTLLL